jgi:hypothetical protein
MRTIFSYILIFISLLAICLSCSNRRGSEVKIPQLNYPLKKKGPGRIVFDKEIHNFGTIKDGEIVSFSFVFRNSGESPFKIIRAEKSCGCIEVKYGNNPISPGESSFVEIVLNSEGEWGNLIKEVSIETSEGELKELQIGGYIENKQFNNLLNIQK